ncbi:MAG: tRNA 4-thiouridine(8) synthase ThiI [Candidatus Mycalebacterium zealandia]|nr:MAG: tRNA 4-thiouridine(8) synthase ThiI [Candidatus Mycalebacterium zealandia]
MEVLVHYGDLTLKGKNRSDFTAALVRNAEAIAGGRFETHRESIVMRDGNPDNLGKVFGISWYARCHTCPKNLDEIVKLALRRVRESLSLCGGEKKTFAVFVKRSDKRFPMKSSEIASKVGEEIRLRFGLKVNISAPDLPVYIRIDSDTARLHFEKKPGLGGLPVGTSAPLLCLLSGGIDSPVAALCAMKRGCDVDFLHFHVFPDSSGVIDTKITDIFSVLRRYSPASGLFFAPYKFFQSRALTDFPDTGSFRGYELVLFRRFMLKVASAFAAEHGYGGIITGDCIGQVASQTIENMGGAYIGLDHLVLSPLLGWDKNEIVEKARRAGTYEHSIKPYNECCSLVSPSPRTKCRISVLRRLEEKVSMDEMVSSTLGSVESYSPAGGNG